MLGLTVLPRRLHTITVVREKQQNLCQKVLISLYNVW